MPLNTRGLSNNLTWTLFTLALPPSALWGTLTGAWRHNVLFRRPGNVQLSGESVPSASDYTYSNNTSLCAQAHCQKGRVCYCTAGFALVEYCQDYFTFSVFTISKQYTVRVFKRACEFWKCSIIIIISNHNFWLLIPNQISDLFYSRICIAYG